MRITIKSGEKQMSSTWGRKIKISIFGGSHSKGIGVTINGLPAGKKIDMDKVLLQMKRRAPGQDKTATTRKEADIPEILCGMNDKGILSGDPLTAIIYNNSQRSSDYENIRINPRPGHADYTAYVKYHKSNDIRGGGHFSGRLTAPIVFAGAVCRQILEERGIHIGAHVSSIGKVEDEIFDKVNINKTELSKLSSQYFPVISKKAKNDMYSLIESVRKNCDSIGGTIECASVGFPVGYGSPMFEGIEGVLSSILFGIPAVKGVEFGAGFAASELLGSENNDEFYYEGNVVKTRTNNSGGILGGITTAMPLIFKVAIKPTPSISKAQCTVNLLEKKDTVLEIKGRHDPCIVPRAVPVVESAAAIALLDILEYECEYK